MSTGCKRNFQISIDGHGSMIDVQEGVDADVKTRIGKARVSQLTLVKPDRHLHR